MEATGPENRVDFHLGLASSAQGEPGGSGSADMDEMLEENRRLKEKIARMEKMALEESDPLLKSQPSVKGASQFSLKRGSASQWLSAAAESAADPSASDTVPASRPSSTASDAVHPFSVEGPSAELSEAIQKNLRPASPIGQAWTELGHSMRPNSKEGLAPVDDSGQLLPPDALEESNGETGRLDSAWRSCLAAWDDEGRDCGLETVAVLCPNLSYAGGYGRLEAEEYRSAMAKMTCSQKALNLLFNVFFGILDPNEAPRMAWDLLMLVSLLYIATMVPVYIGFNTSPGELSLVLYIADKVIDVCFMLDIWMNFRTAYHSPVSMKLVKKRAKISRHYAETWLVLDLVSSIPIDWILADEGEGSIFRLIKTSRFSKLLKILRILRLMKLVRIMKLPGLLAQLRSVVGKSMLRISTFFASGAMIAHWMACLFYWCATFAAPDDEDYPGWTVSLEGEDLDGNNEWKLQSKYVASLYWSFSTITTVGYGDLVPTTTTERLIAILCMVVGVTMFGYFMGSMTSIVAAMNETKQAHDKRVEAMENFLSYRDIPANLAGRVRAYYEFLWDRELQQEEQSWMGGLNGALRTEMILYMYQDAVSRVPFFHGKNPHFIASLVQNLKPETYAPCDVVSREGEPATCMYFVSRGRLEVCLRVSDEVAQDVLCGKQVPKQVNSGSDPDGHSELTRLKSMDKTHRHLFQSYDNAGDDGHDFMEPSVVNFAQEDTTDARKKVIMSMQSLRKRQQLRGGVRRKGAAVANVEEESSSDEEDGDAGPEDEVIYVIPDDELKLKPRQKRHMMPNRSRGFAAQKKDVMPDLGGNEFHEMFSLSRRATRVHTDLEMIEAVSLMGNGAHAYRRMGLMRPGMYFGEYSCLLGLRRTITVVAIDFVEVFALTGSALESILEDWPDIESEFRSLVVDEANKQSSAAQPAMVRESMDVPAGKPTAIRQSFRQLARAAVLERVEAAEEPVQESGPSQWDNAISRVVMMRKRRMASAQAGGQQDGSTSAPKSVSFVPPDVQTAHR